MVAIQPVMAAPLVRAVEMGKDEAPPIPTKSSALFSIGVSTSSIQSVKTLRESSGIAAGVSDDEVLHMQRDLGRLEGLYAEQSSVASVAGVAKLVADGRIPHDATVVCVLTSGGLKDVDAPGRGLPSIAPIHEDWNEFARFMKSTHNLTV